MLYANDIAGVPVQGREDHDPKAVEGVAEKCSQGPKKARRKLETVPGERYGHLTVVREVPRVDSKYRRIEVLCDCGTVTVKDQNSVYRGGATCCGYGCASSGRRKYRTVSGKRYGHLTVLKEIRRPESNLRWIEVLCDCGKTTVKHLSNVTNGSIKCCSKKCVYSGSWKHGLSIDPLYHSWHRMHERCKPSNRRHARYFDRGIRVCERWGNLDNFREDMSPTWKAGLQLDRIDNDGGYSPENCRWVTFIENARNRPSRKSPIEALDLARSQVNFHTYYSRLKLGWTPMEAASEPSKNFRLESWDQRSKHKPKLKLERNSI